MTNDELFNGTCILMNDELQEIADKYKVGTLIQVTFVDGDITTHEEVTDELIEKSFKRIKNDR